MDSRNLTFSVVQDRYVRCLSTRQSSDSHSHTEGEREKSVFFVSCAIKWSERLSCFSLFDFDIDEPFLASRWSTWIIGQTWQQQRQGEFGAVAFLHVVNHRRYCDEKKKRRWRTRREKKRAMCHHGGKKLVLFFSSSPSLAFASWIEEQAEKRAWRPNNHWNDAWVYVCVYASSGRVRVFFSFLLLLLRHCLWLDVEFVFW